MAKVRSVKFNFVMNFLLTLSGIIFPIITYPYVSRVLGPGGTGKVSFATSVISYFSMFAQLGIPTYGIRACAKVRDDKEELTKTVQELLLINLILSIAAYIVFYILLFRVQRFSQDKSLYVVISATILFNIIGMEWLYKGIEQYAYITIRSVIFKFVALIAMFLLVHDPDDYVIYGAVSILASSASNIFNFFHAHHYISMKISGQLNLRRHFPAVLVFFAMSCATTVYTNLDNVMLGFMTTDADVGYYNAAVKIKIVLVSLVTSLGAVLLPRSSYYIEHGMLDEFHQVSKKAINFVFVVALPLSVYFILFSRESILFLFGEKYVPSIMAMMIIMPTVLLIGLTNIMGIQILVPLGWEKWVLISEVAGAITDFIINLLLIPVMHSAGAALGTLIAEFAVWLVQFRCLYRDIVPAYRHLRYPAILISTVIAGLVSIWTKRLTLGGMSTTASSFVILLISAILFFGVYCVLLLVLKEPMMCQMKDQLIQKIKRR